MSGQEQMLNVLRERAAYLATWNTGASQNAMFRFI